MRMCAWVMLAITAGGCSGSNDDSADAAPEGPAPAWLERFDGTTTLTFEVPSGNPIPDQVVPTAWVGTEAIADDYDVSLDRDDEFDRWFAPLATNETAGEVVAGYSFGSFIADDPGGNTTVIMMTATGGQASVASGLALTVEGTIRAQQGLEVADGTFVATFAP